jgi:hypothetical protein
MHGKKLSPEERKLIGKVQRLPAGIRYATDDEFEKAKQHVFTKHRELLKNLAKR